MRRPVAGEYAPYFEGYINLTQGTDILQQLEDSSLELLATLENLPQEKGDYRYAASKWTIAQMIRHLIDTDQVFLYRALSLVRNKGGELSGFDQDAWAENSMDSELVLADLLLEFRQLRQFAMSFFKGLSEEQWEVVGIVSGSATSVRSIPYILTGHALHHTSILRKRYL